MKRRTSREEYAYKHVSWLFPPHRITYPLHSQTMEHDAGRMPETMAYHPHRMQRQEAGHLLIFFSNLAVPCREFMRLLQLSLHTFGSSSLHLIPRLRRQACQVQEAFRKTARRSRAARHICGIRHYFLSALRESNTRPRWQLNRQWKQEIREGCNGASVRSAPLGGCSFRHSRGGP